MDHSFFRRMEAVMRNVCRGTAFAICAVLAALTILLVLPGAFGIHPLAVQSGSMEPAYPRGSLIYIKSIGQSELQEGRAVTFYLSDGETLVTHRIVEIDREKGTVCTKGDANELEDTAKTPFSRIVGRPFLCIPLLGYLAGYLASPAGKAGILLLVVMVCILAWMDGSVQQNGKDREHEQI